MMIPNGSTNAHTVPATADPQSPADETGFARPALVEENYRAAPGGACGVAPGPRGRADA